jgi:hypothetical protein
MITKFRDFKRVNEQHFKTLDNVELDIENSVEKMILDVYPNAKVGPIDRDADSEGEDLFFEVSFDTDPGYENLERFWSEISKSKNWHVDSRVLGGELVDGRYAYTLLVHV